MSIVQRKYGAGGERSAAVDDQRSGEGEREEGRRAEDGEVAGGGKVLRKEEVIALSLLQRLSVSSRVHHHLIKAQVGSRFSLGLRVEGLGSRHRLGMTGPSGLAHSLSPACAKQAHCLILLSHPLPLAHVCVRALSHTHTYHTLSHTHKTR